MVTVKSGGKLLEAISFFPIIANGPYGCFPAFKVFVIIVVVLKGIITIAFYRFLENKDNLNKEERAFSFH